jgi:Zn-dependent peptidase ImmA (M78 family)
VYAALRVRHRAGVALTAPANPIDIAEKIGVQVWFQQTPSMEGMFVQTPDPQILLSSMRPSGRINFTCAHELGHYYFGHAVHVDLDSGDEPLLLADSQDEFQANSFASSLLMPKTTVQQAFVRRQLAPASATPFKVLAIAHWLGVGYTTLVHNLHRSLQLLAADQATALLKHQPKKIVEAELGVAVAGFVLVDRAWSAKSVDMQVGDVAIVEGEVNPSGACVRVEKATAGYSLVEAVHPGTGHLNGGSGWSTYVRVCRFQFEGRSIFRHLEEATNAGE